jgi:hypothetical protein
VAVELVDDNDVEMRADPTMPMSPNGIRRLAMVQPLPGRARLPGHGHWWPGAGGKGGSCSSWIPVLGAHPQRR